MGLAEDLEAVADPQHQAPAGGELDHRVHRRREAGDGAGPEVVAVGEPARDDHRVGSPEVALGVPHQLRLADQAGGMHGVPVIAGAGELDNRELHLVRQAGVSSSWTS